MLNRTREADTGSLIFGLSLYIVLRSQEIAYSKWSEVYLIQFGNGRTTFSSLLHLSSRSWAGALSEVGNSTGLETRGHEYIEVR
ncbi:hypothetical protein R1flu_012551 [Riccia fluitans]|uniref:Uncharacterized protein n=1 Tax=Riccia fluitans TaxID=41844 RepID=A0ABD1ZC25_9MARC